MAFSLFRGREPDNVRPDALEALLNSAFEKELGQFDERMSKLVTQLKEAFAQFAASVEEFKKVKGNPDVEDMYGASPSSIAAQKESYARTLGRTAAVTIEPKGDAANSYERYRPIFESASAAANEILGANFRFKQVMYGYAGHLSGLKASYSSIERHVSAMGLEFSQRSGDLASYNELKGRISRLESDIQELAGLAGAMAALEGMAAGSDGDAARTAESGMRARLEGKARELEEQRRRNAFIRDRITQLTLPLERASKKFDHVSGAKRSLSKFVSDPAGTITSDLEYAAFTAMAKNMQRSISSGEIALKSAEETNERINELLNSDLYGIITELRAAAAVELELERECKSLDSELAGLRGASESMARSREELEAMARRGEALESSISEGKRAIEGLFLRRYSMRIRIT